MLHQRLYQGLIALAVFCCHLSILNAQELTLEQEIQLSFERLNIPLAINLPSTKILFWEEWQKHKIMRPEWGKSVLGRDLPFFYFPAKPQDENSLFPVNERTVFFLGGIHANEVSPLFSSFKLLAQLFKTGASPFKGVNIVYLPLSNPDGFIVPVRKYKDPTRNNAKNIDLNRDFVPAAGTRSQPETGFIKELISFYQPTYIVSLHGPYCWLDYDGPITKDDASPEEIRDVDQWLYRISAAAVGKELPINKNFRTYKGSLGNYAGELLKIHTLTFEYAEKHPRYAYREWEQFGASLWHSLDISEEYSRAWRKY